MFSILVGWSSSARSGTASYTYDARGDLVSAAYSGGPSITYVYDALGNRVSETITNAPVLQNSVSTVAYNASNASLTLNIGGNATGLQITGGPAHGSASVSGLSIRYTPTSSYSGSDSLSYTASNSAGTSNTATVSITVNPAPPVAGNVNQTVAYNSGFTSVTLALSGGAAASVAASQPSHGATSVSGLQIGYQPTASYYGFDTFTYTATNVTGTSAPATAYITVNPAIPTAGNVSQTVLYNSSYTTITLSLGGGSATGVSVASGPSHGSTQVSGTQISYKPTANYSGSDSFTYTASNTGGTSSAATA